MQRQLLQQQTQSADIAGGCNNAIRRYPNLTSRKLNIEMRNEHVNTMLHSEEGVY